MSTQAFSQELPKSPELPKLPEFENQPQTKSLLDEPWKVTLIPAAAPVGEDPHEAKSLPWRVGDVTRLKDDSPKGMMEYIATHSTGWWREMAERALRDTEKAERMAREQGWEYGQYWALEVDAEARQKLLDAEEAKRVREQAERAKGEAEKEAFVQRQVELLKKAGRAPRCEYQYTDGRGCKAPQVRGERWCHGHAKMMSCRPEKLEILPMEDEQAAMVNLYRVTQSLLSGRISEKVAGLTLWSIAIGMPGARKLSPRRSRRAQRKSKILPRISADERGSERKVCSELTRTNTKQECARRDVDDSGVTSDKSFISGVAHGRTPGAKVRGSDCRENSLKRHGRNQHSRDLSTPPRVAHASSESLKTTRGGERGEKLQTGMLRTQPAQSGHDRIWASEHRSIGISSQQDIGTSHDQKSSFIDN